LSALVGSENSHPLPTGADWLHEVKYDSCRMMVACNGID
jgi:ATP-dependent DNA ligase